MRPLTFLFTATLVSLWTACQKARCFERPSDLGHGLPPADSLRAVLTWLSKQKSYEAETLRFHYLYEYIRTLSNQKPDTLPALAQMMTRWAAETPYPIGKGISALAWAQALRVQGQSDSAFSQAQTALKAFQAQGRLDYEGHARDLIGLLYQARGLYTEALAHYEETLQIRERLGDQQGLAYSYNNTGNIHHDQGQYAEALAYHQKALQIKERIGDQQGLANSYRNVGDLYRDQGLYPQARTCLHKALDLAQALKLRDQPDDIYLSLALTDSALAASDQPAYWRSAYEHQRLHIVARYSVLNKESIRKQAQLESQYEYDKKTALLKAQQDKERALAQAEMQRRKTEPNALSAVLDIVLIALGGMGYYQILLRRKNRLIQAQAEQLRQENAELELFNAELDATNRALAESNRVIQAQAQQLAEKTRRFWTASAMQSASSGRFCPPSRNGSGSCRIAFSYISRGILSRGTFTGWRRRTSIFSWA